jgi:hypothetical protein
MSRVFRQDWRVLSFSSLAGELLSEIRLPRSVAGLALSLPWRAVAYPGEILRFRVTWRPARFEDATSTFGNQRSGQNTLPHFRSVHDRFLGQFLGRNFFGAS